MFPRNENRNEGTFACSPERKPERRHIRQNHPFTNPPFCLPVKRHRNIWHIDNFSVTPGHQSSRPGTRTKMLMFLGFHAQPLKHLTPGYPVGRPPPSPRQPLDKIVYVYVPFLFLKAFFGIFDGLCTLEISHRGHACRVVKKSCGKVLDIAHAEQ